MTIIELEDGLNDVIVKMSGGNPGAATVLVDIMKSVPKYDPKNAMGGIGCILSLDSFGIYKEKIWMLYKDVCKEDTSDVIFLLRACQMGNIAREDLVATIEGKCTIDVRSLVNEVKETLYGD